MTENIKEALQYAVQLRDNEKKIIQDEIGIEWYDANRFNLKELKEEIYYPDTIYLNTLTSLTDYLLSGLNRLSEQNLIVLVDTPTKVKIYSENDEREKRVTLVSVEAEIPEFNFDKYYDMENFNIALQARFKNAADRELVIDFASKITIENGADIEDDGMAQITTIKQGVASKGKAKAPNPVTLVPYRTFTEVEQPASDFVFRINKEGKLALFEADGGAWRLEAMQNVADYLREAFADYDNITVLA